MDAKQTVNSWLSKINPSDAGMALNQYGQCQLVTKEGESCIVYVPQSTSTEFHLFLDIASLPDTCGASVYEGMLKLNLPCEVTRGGALAYDPQTRNVVFNYSREIAITDIRTFCAILENFLNAAKGISKQIKALLGESTEKARPRSTARTPLLNRMHPSSSIKF